MVNSLSSIVQPVQAWNIEHRYKEVNKMGILFIVVEVKLNYIFLMGQVKVTNSIY